MPALVDTRINKAGFFIESNYFPKIVAEIIIHTGYVAFRP